MICPSCGEFNVEGAANCKNCAGALSVRAKKENALYEHAHSGSLRTDDKPRVSESATRPTAAVPPTEKAAHMSSDGRRLKVKPKSDLADPRKGFDCNEKTAAGSKKQGIEDSPQSVNEKSIATSVESKSRKLSDTAKGLQPMMNSPAGPKSAYISPSERPRTANGEGTLKRAAPPYAPQVAQGQGGLKEFQKMKSAKLSSRLAIIMLIIFVSLAVFFIFIRATGGVQATPPPGWIEAEGRCIENVKKSIEKYSNNKIEYIYVKEGNAESDYVAIVMHYPYSEGVIPDSDKPDELRQFVASSKSELLSFAPPVATQGNSGGIVYCEVEETANMGAAIHMTIKVASKGKVSVVDMLLLVNNGRLYLVQVANEKGTSNNAEIEHFKQNMRIK